MTEPDPTEVEQYKSLWTTEKSDWLLVADESDSEPPIINISREYPEATVFTDDGLATALRQRMQEAGIPVVTWNDVMKAHQRRRAEQ
jgi:rRNA-processing protein FCF1